MVRCSIIGCKSDSERKISGLSFHSFPDVPELRNLWIATTKRINWVPKRSSKICSKHFEKKNLWKKGKKTFLNPDAVPNTLSDSETPDIDEPMEVENNETVCLEKSSTECLEELVVSRSIVTTSVTSEAKKEITNTFNIVKRAEEVETLEELEVSKSTASTSKMSLAKGKNIPQATKTLEEFEVFKSTASTSKTSLPKRKNIPQANKTGDGQDYSPRTLRRKWKQTEEKATARLKKLKAVREKSRRLTKKVANLEKMIAELKAKSLISEEDGDLLESIDPINRDFLKKFLNPSVGSRKYSPELRKFALYLHFISPRAYKYVRQQFDTCLPHPSTLSSWYKSVDATPGFTSESFECIKLLAKHKKLYCAMCMDEMAIRKHVQWNGTQCVGLVNYGEALDGHNITEAKEALVFLINSINSSWKLPVGYFLINGCTGEQKANLVKQCLNLLIVDCGINVVSLTFDGCPANFAMAKSLGCCIDQSDNVKPFFTAENQEVTIFPDPAHMLKLVRNALGEKKVIINSQGGIISWTFIEELNNLQESEGLHLANRLRSQHVNFTKQIMKVKLAAQTFSNSVADAIEFCNKQLHLPEFLGSEATVDFIRKINNLFDVLNSRNLKDYTFKKPINRNNSDHILNFITEMEHYIRGLTLFGKPILVTNRKVGFLGFLLCIQSLKHMNANLISTDKLKFLPTYKLSQDHLECFFSSIRSKGGYNNNPTALQFQSAYKRLVVHGEIKSISSGNCIPLEDIKILTHTDVRYENKLNKYTHLNTEDSILNTLNDDDIVIDKDHDYLSDPSRLSVYSEEIIPYIGGFVVRRLKKVIKCEDCLLSLISKKYLGLIAKKDKGGLIYPSQDVIKVCSLGEKTFRQHSNEGIKFFADKNIMPQLILASFKRCQGVFIEDHFQNQPFVGNHRILLIKAILMRYFELRIHHATKAFTPKEKIRNMHTKLVLFKGQ